MQNKKFNIKPSAHNSPVKGGADAAFYNVFLSFKYTESLLTILKA